MCGRYAISDQAAVERELRAERRWWKIQPSYNVAPGRYVPVLRLHERVTEGVMMRWGLVPAAAEGKPPAREIAEAPAEQLTARDALHFPWLAGQRCIVPVSGFYLWQRSERGHLQPHFVWIDGREVFGLAALHERSVSEEDDVTESFALVTVPATPRLAALDNRNSRMPVILARDDYERWLSATPGEAKKLLRAESPRRLRHHAVSPRVNQLSVDEPSLIEPAEADAFELGASFRVA